jgi:hypothetical protein
MRDDSHKEAGATPVVHVDPNDACLVAGKSYGYHKDIWVWESGAFTDRVQCTTCGRIAKKTRSEQATIEGMS